MSRKGRLLSAVLAFGVALGSSRGAFAATEQERSAARDLAEQGAQAYEAGRYEEAYDHFTRASALVKAPTVLLFLARTCGKLGKLIQAREAYNTILRQELGADATSAFRSAQQTAETELAAIEGRIPRVTIEVKGAEGREFRVLVDGTEINRALLNVPQPIDPGSHRFEAAGDGLESTPVDLAFAEGAKQTVSLEVRVLPGAPPPVAGASASAGDTGAADRPSSKKPVIAYVALGVGAVGLGFGTFMGIRHFSKKGESNDLFEECNPRRCTPSEQGDIDTLDSSAATAGTLSMIGLGVGVAGVGTGLYLLLKPSGSSSEATVGVRLSPTGGSVVGRF